MTKKISEGSLNWLGHVYEGLVNAGACMDCLLGEQFMSDDNDVSYELIEAIGVDIDRAFKAVHKILECHGRLPEYLKKDGPSETTIPF